MTNLNLKGPLNLMGNLTLTPPSKGKVTVNDQEALVVMIPPVDPAHSQSATQVIQPPPPASPADTGSNVWVINSLNQTVRIGQQAIVAQGFVMQGGKPGGVVGPPLWPGMVLPSQNNAGPIAVTVNYIPINVLRDQALIFPSGGVALLDAASGQEET